MMIRSYIFSINICFFSVGLDVMRMDEEHIHVPLFLTAIWFFLLTTLPQSHSQPRNNTKFYECSKPFSCGKVSDISYPFWDSESRPSYCGGGDQFKLTCPYNQYPSIQFGSQNLEVKKINTADYTMIMAQFDLLAYEECSSYLSNNSLNPNLFWYTKSVHNITVFYDCPTKLSIGGNTFPCPKDGTQKSAFYVEETQLQQFPELQKCERRIQVPVLQDVPLHPQGGLKAFAEAFNGGFEVSYFIEPQCKTCWQSHGACGSDDNSNHQFSCHCEDGSDAVDCYPHRIFHKEALEHKN